MKKYEIKDETFYYQSGKFYDENFIEVDTATNNRIIDYLEKNNMLNVSTNKNKHIYKKIDNTGNASSTTLTEDKVKSRMLRLEDYGLDESMLEVHKKAIEKYEAKEKEVASQNYSIQQERWKKEGWAIFIALATFFACMLIGYLISPNEGLIFGIIGIVVSFFVTRSYYNNSIKPLAEKKKVDKYSFVSKELDEKVSRYNSDKLKYDEELRRTTKIFWENLDPFEFEAEVAKFFRALGAGAQTTSKVNDGGYDVVVHYNNKRYAIECKHHASPVGPAYVDRLRGVVIGKFDGGIFISLNGYTQAAIERNRESNKPMILLSVAQLTQLAKKKNLDDFLNK